MTRPEIAMNELQRLAAVEAIARRAAALILEIYAGDFGSLPEFLRLHRKAAGIAT